MKKRVLVTGGAGYIGSHTAVELVNAGFDVVIADNLCNSDSETIEGIRKITGAEVSFVQADCCDKDAMESLFKQYEIGAVIHFAAYKSVNESVAKPLEYYRNNIGSLVTLLDVMRRMGVRDIIFSSSCTVYGQADTLPVTEKTPKKRSSSPYGNTKHICEDILRDSTAAYDNLHCIALRYFNPIGAHPSAIIGEKPLGVPQNLVPFIAQTAAGIHRELKVFGDDYDTPDGTCMRDYIDVVDLAGAHVTALERLLENGGTKHEVFNIGTGKALSVMQLIRTFETVNGVRINCKVAERRPGDIAAIWADTTLANELLGWRAERPIEETLKSVWAYEKRIRGI